MVMPAYDFNAKTLDFVERLNRMGVAQYLIAQRLCISATTLAKYINMAGLVPAFARAGGWPKSLPIKEAVELYVCEGWSTHQLARYYGWSHSGIGNRLRAAGVVLRGS